ncbi:MAG: mycothiol system anti-sigma-R factor [Actinomycetaceae bacterium]|nr:mycothiol system anti-sigma-R factor [Actinomycetaceae bacterium]
MREASDDACTGCDDFVTEFFAYMDNELAVERIEILRAHASSCPHCRQLEDAELHLRGILRRACIEKAPSTLRERIVTQISMWQVSVAK